MKKIAKKRKKLGKVKDLWEKMEDGLKEFEHYLDHIKKGKK